MLSRQLAQPYIGKVVDPAVLPGLDAAVAIRRWGCCPSVLLATHVVVVWEYADLCTALELPGETFPTGLVVLEASMDAHVVRWHPFRMHLGPGSAAGCRRCARSGASRAGSRTRRCLRPVVELLAVWRAVAGR